MTEKERKQWFLDRIGKRVYRCKLSCTCPSCKNGTENGVLITDELHANYLCDVSMEIGVKYFDTKEEIGRALF